MTFLFRSSFQFFNTRVPENTPFPVQTCSGRVHPLSVGDNVYLVEDVQYRVTQILPDQQAVRLQRINTTNRPFRRSWHQICLASPLTSDSTCAVDLPTNNCLCPDPEPPKVHPDTDDIAIQCELTTDKALDDWCSIMTDFSCVDHLNTAFCEAREEAMNYFDLYEKASAEAVAIRSSLANAQLESERLKATLEELRVTHNQLLQESLHRIEEINELKSQLKRKTNTSPDAAIQLLLSHLTSLPTDFEAETTPDDTLYHFLCCKSDADTTFLSSQVNALLRLIHPDKNTLTGPLAHDAARLVPLITNIKRVLMHPPLRVVYDHCGLTGLHDLLSRRLFCPECLPNTSDGRPAKQGRIEYPQLYLLFKS